MPGPLCPSCGEKRLEAWGDEGGYLCPKGPKAKDGSGCRKLVSKADYKSLMEDEMAEQSRSETSTKNGPSSSKGGPPAKKARAEEDLERGAQIAAALAAPSALQRSNTAESNMEDDEEWEEDEAASFDAMNSQTVTTDKDTNKMRVRREPAMGLLSLSAVDMVLRGAFIVPRGSESGDMSSLATVGKGRRLGVRLPLSAFNMKPSFMMPRASLSPEEKQDDSKGLTEDDLKLPPLVLWDPVRDARTAEQKPIQVQEAIENEYQHAFVKKNQVLLDEYKQAVKIAPDTVVVEPFLCKFLREHQRQGVQFMFECVLGLRDFDGNGCILADDMGLGKTFQSVTLLWTLLTQGIGGRPAVKRVAVVCPTSLVKNWAAEITKWLGDRLDGGVVAISESTREKVIDAIHKYCMTNVYAREQKYPPVLIISYETFRIHHKRFGKNGPELIICDEAHRLKNDKTATTKSLAGLPCRKRVLLSGTPMQNDLEEFFAMVDFTNPGVLGTCSEFRRKYQSPILNGREPDASDAQLEKGQKAQTDLSTVVNSFILRRTNELLSKHLPPKVVQVVCCRMTPMQLEIYDSICNSKEVAKVVQEGEELEGKGGKMVLSCITSLKKLCNHPRLIWDAIRDAGGKNPTLASAAKVIPPGTFEQQKGANSNPRPELSGKIAVLDAMLKIWYHEKKERCVLISNYTQTLDIFEDLCRFNGMPFVRLDGSTGTGKRQKLVDEFNDPMKHQFAFLLSSKAGGCGLNLVGASRLVLFDPDWNPANDKQAGARIWRDGQCRLVFEYRFLATGSIEEKVYQRQLSKEGLQGGLFESELQVSTTSSDELRKLFELRPETISDTYDGLGFGDAPCRNQQVGTPAMEMLQHWGHHDKVETVPDDSLQRAGQGLVSFVFSNQVDGNEAKLTAVVHGKPKPQVPKPSA